MLSQCLRAAIPVLLAVSAWADSSVPKPGFNLFSRDQDIQLGKEAAAQVRQQYPAVQNQFLQDYIQRVGRRLATQPEAGNYPYTFTLLNDKSVNAFALPGGPTFVFTGLLSAVDNEAQLAGVLAHEISHVALRHGTNQASKANLLQIPALIAGAVVGNGSMLGQLAQAGIGLGFNSVLLKFSRTDESQADNLGARIMAQAGYNPIEMARFFEKLESQGGSRAPQFLSDHPNPGNRERALEAEIRTFPQRDYSYTTGEFQRAKTQVASIPAPSPSRAARQTRSDAGTGQWKQLRGANLALDYPGAWQVFGDNRSSMLTIAPRDGLVQDSGGRTQIGQGAIVSYFFPDDGQPASLQNGTRDLIHHLRSQNPNMQIVSNPRAIQVDGQPALLTELESASPFGGAERDHLVTVSRPEGLFYMVFITPSSDAAPANQVFNQMLTSIRFS